VVDSITSITSNKQKFFHSSKIESFVQVFSQSSSNKTIALRGNGLQIITFDDNNDEFSMRDVIIEDEGKVITMGVLIN